MSTTIDLTALVVQDTDTVEIVKFVHIVTDEDIKYDPIKKDDDRLVQYAIGYPCVTSTMTNEYGNPVTVYYFWATDTDTPHGSSGIAINRIQSNLHNKRRSFHFYSDLTGMEYASLVIVGIDGIDDSTAIRFTDKQILDTQPSEYSEWEMIRRGQRTNIPRVLWNRLVEAIVGFKVDFESGTVTQIPVPAIDVKLTDTVTGTADQYGIGNKQILCPSENAVEALNSILLNPTVDLYPIDRNAFMMQYNLDTPENVIELMDAVFTTFSPELVNTIWFKSLYAGLAANPQYEGIIKTSYVHLDSVQTLNV